jgi:hypothetical protein
LIKRKNRMSDTGKAGHQSARRERVSLRKQINRRNAKLPAQRVDLPNGATAAVALRNDPNERFDIESITEAASRYHPNSDGLATERLIEAFRTEDRDFVWGLAQQLIHAGARLPGDGLSFMLAVIKGIKPNDQLEAMLGAQSAAVHVAILTTARRFAEAEFGPERDSAERALTKLTRIFTTQMETLKRYRTGGEQKVTVQHVSVGEGGQAIVGTITQAGRTITREAGAETRPALTDARQPAMEVISESARAPVPLRRREKDDEPPSA